MSAIANAYAKAWLELALEKNKVEDTLLFLEGVKEGLANQADLLKHPKLKPSDVLSLFKSTTDDSFLIALMRNVIDQKRLPELLNIIDAFIAQHQTLNRSKVIQVISATLLDESKIEAIKKSFSQFQDVDIQVTIDPTIIGGIKLSYDDKVFDASSQTLLNRLKQSISR